jgi:hypothetical protein
MSRIAQLLRELADEIDRTEVRAAVPVEKPPKVHRARPMRKQYVPKAQLSEIDLARARETAKRYRIPIGGTG